MNSVISSLIVAASLIVSPQGAPPPPAGAGSAPAAHRHAPAIPGKEMRPAPPRQKASGEHERRQEHKPDARREHNSAPRPKSHR